MERCFNFLVNVDQCLNMSNFDMFFYKLQSSSLFHLNNVQFNSEDPATSLLGAARDIRMHLNKFPFQMSSYRIVVTMRRPLPDDSTVPDWKETMLYRLLRVYYALEEANIFINSRELMDRTLHFIMLYDTDMTVEIKDFGTYDMQNDFRILLGTLGLEDRLYTDDKEFVALLREKYSNMPEEDEILSNVIHDFLAQFEKGLTDTEEVLERNRNIRETFTSGGVYMEDCRLILEEHIKAKIDRYLVTERHIDKNNREQNLLELLRVVEYLNRDLSDRANIGQDTVARSLYQRCSDTWKQTVEDRTFASSYARRLRSYEARLLSQQNSLERPYVDRLQVSNLPKRNKPAPDAIDVRDSNLSTDMNDRSGNALKETLKDFRRVRWASRKKDAWTETVGRINRAVETMSRDLQNYASELSTIYSGTLEERGSQFRILRLTHYKADRQTAREAAAVEHERELLLTELKGPTMNPSLQFQDQLNMENVLRQTDQDVAFYTGCMKKIHFTAFAGFFLSVALLTLLHYSFLHMPVFRNSQRILVWVIYCTLILLFMLAAWRRPYHYYNGKIEKCLKKLEEAMDTYISGYYDKARNFRAYINELNQLDECTRYLRLLTETNNESMLQARLYLWNKVQVRLHLEKLSFFRGLFEYGPVEASGEDAGAAFETSEPRLDQDVIHNPLFWP